MTDVAEIVIAAEAMTPVETCKLERLEHVIDSGLSHFRRVGLALLEIRDARLYRADHVTFEAYLTERWGMHKSHAARTIEAAQVADRIAKLPPLGEVVPANERQVRALTALPPEDQPAAWAAAVDRAGGGQPSGREVDEVVREVRGIPAALTSSKSNEWYTPAPYVEAARELMGGIDLDPASCEQANATVQAAKFYARADDGLAQEWRGRVWINPPYGKLDGKFGPSNQKLWTESVIGRYERKEIDQAVVLVGARTGEQWFQPLWYYPICFTDHRVKFDSPGDSNDQPGQGSALVYLGSDTKRFVKIFSQFGQCVVPADGYSEAR
jgi:hypothetical protein